MHCMKFEVRNDKITI